MFRATSQSRKKRGVIIEENDQTNTKKKQKLDRDSFSCSQCYKVLRSMREERFGWLFEEHLVKNPGYYSVISKPMDFVTIKSKLDKNLYVNTADEFPEDVRLVFANAMRFYPPENPVHKNAKKLKEIFEFRWESVKKSLACEYPRLEVKQSRPATSSSSGRYYLDQKVSLSRNPVKEQTKKDKPESKSDQDSKGFVMAMPLSPEKAIRAATIRILFADAIVKARNRKLIDESSNKADVMMRIQKQNQLFQRRQRLVIAGIEGATRAARLKERREEQLALEMLGEEAKSSIHDNLESDREMVNLCGSYLESMQRMGELGLLIIDDYWPELEEIKELEEKEEGEI